jgi:hypothetical protein
MESAACPIITSVSKFRGPPEWCEVRRRVLYKICKKGFRARVPRGRDAWEPLIDIKSYSTTLYTGLAMTAGHFTHRCPLDNTLTWQTSTHLCGHGPTCD